MKIYTRLLFAATRGELLAPRSRAVFQAQDVVGTLRDQVTKRCAMRLSERDRTVFKSWEQRWKIWRLPHCGLLALNKRGRHSLL